MQSAVLAMIDSDRHTDDRPSHTGIMPKRLQLRSCCQSSLEDSPITSFLTVNFRTKFQREHREQGRRMREG